MMAPTSLTKRLLRTIREIGPRFGAISVLSAPSALAALPAPASGSEVIAPPPAVDPRQP